MYAANLCSELVLGGYDDWFLPSRDELNLMYINLHSEGLGNFLSQIYWGSTEYPNDDLGINQATRQYFTDGYQTWYGKNNWLGVRAARQF